MNADELSRMGRAMSRVANPAADRATILEAHAVTARAIGRCFGAIGKRSSAPYAPLLAAVGACLIAAADEIDAEAARAAR